MLLRRRNLISFLWDKFFLKETLWWSNMVASAWKDVILRDTCVDEHQRMNEFNQCHGKWNMWPDCFKWGFFVKLSKIRDNCVLSLLPFLRSIRVGWDGYYWLSNHFIILCHTHWTLKINRYCISSKAFNWNPYVVLHCVCLNSKKSEKSIVEYILMRQNNRYLWHEVVFFMPFSVQTHTKSTWLCHTLRRWYSHSHTLNLNV